MKNSTVLLLVSVIAFLGCKSKEEIELDKQRLEVEKMQLEVQKRALKTVLGPDDQEKLSLITSVMRQWKTLESAYYLEHNKISSNFDTIGFDLPSRVSYLNMQSENNGFSIELTKQIGECPAGAQWEIHASPGKDMPEFKYEMTSSKCTQYTPEFAKGNL
jgi:hypothetical protein